MKTKHFLLAALIIFICAGMLCTGGVAEKALAQTEFTQIWSTPYAYQKATGKKVGAFKQSSYLDIAVSSGELPPVEERLPEEPLVVLGCEGIGKYGGAFIEPVENSTVARFGNPTGQLIWNKYGIVELYPNLLKDFVQVGRGGEVWELQLRKGLKWSDGYPFTADDILFYINDVAKDTTGLVMKNPNSEFDGVKAIKVNDYTVRITYPIPKTAVEVKDTGSLAYFGGMFPFHYLRQFHPKYIGEEEYKKQMKEAKFDLPYEYWDYAFDRFHQNDPNKPTMDAWIRVTYKESGIVVWRRNPYYFAVDPEGNQLPYFDEFHQVITGGFDVSLLRALNGDVSWFDRSGVDNYIVAKKAEQEGKCRVLPMGGIVINCADLEFNVTHEDPVLRKLFKNINFKMGVSHALNRPQYNEVIYYGTAEPWQVAPWENDLFYNERAAHVALEYDLDKANQLLDEAGLDRKNADGWRLRPDGMLLEITVLQGEMRLTGEKILGEMMVEDLQKVGIKAVWKFMDFTAAFEITETNKHDAFILGFSWGTYSGAFDLWGAPMYSFVEGIGNFRPWAPEWMHWWLSDGKKGEKPDQIMLDVMDWVKKSKATTNIEQKKMYWKKILDVYADNLWGIGTLKYPGGILIVAPYMRNVPNPKLGLADSGRQDAMYSDQE